MSKDIRDGETDCQYKSRARPERTFLTFKLSPDLNGELLLRQVSTYATPTDAFAGLSETGNESRIKSNVTDADERDPDFEVFFVQGDGKDPRSWPRYKRMYHLGTLSYMVTVVALYSTSYTSGLPGIVEEFGCHPARSHIGLDDVPLW
jgi:hypothetical protein